MTIDLGDTYRLSMRNLSPAGDLVTATNMALSITLPDDTVTVINPVTAGSTGVYTYDYATVQAGRHLARWLATGTGAGAYIEAATSAAEDHRDEVLAKRTFTWKTWGNGQASVVLPKRPVVSLTSLVNAESGVTFNPAGYDVNGSTGRITALRGGSFVGLLEFTYVAGYTIIPAAYTLAVRMIIQHLWETQRGPMGASRFAGSLDDAALMRFRSMNIFVPPRAQELLGDRMPMV